MNENEIKKALFTLLKKIAPDTEPEKLDDNDNIRRTLGIDSFDYLQFIIAMDKQFGIHTPEEDYGKITNMKELIAYMKTTKKI